jgi:hypothetical protein
MDMTATILDGKHVAQLTEAALAERVSQHQKPL